MFSSKRDNAINRIFKLVLLFSLLIIIPSSIAEHASKVTGTYTNMQFNNEGGDLLGQELKIVLTRKGYQGAQQFAEGGAGELIVDVHIETDQINFVIPDSYSEAGQFSGTIQNGKIPGLFKFKRGGEEKIDLGKGKSYWD
jgi:hypothetical protein